MPRPLALFLTCAFVFYLFRRDIRQKPNISGAVWIPLTWFLIVGTRPVYEWMALLGINVTGSLEEGNPLERTVSMVLIGAGVYVLAKRRVSLVAFVKNNVWVSAYIAYCFFAIWWSDYTFVSFKRWTRSFGEPIMILILLTEVDRMEALTRFIKRATYVIAPFSIMLIKYFPEIGKYFSEWGIGQSSGVTNNKNALGRVCMVLGLFLFCHLVRIVKSEKTIARRNEILLTAVLLWMVWWNLLEARSSTALASLVIGMIMVVAIGSPVVHKRFVGFYIVGAVSVAFAADSVFGLYERVILLLGEDVTLTGRTDLWRDILAIDINPFLGVGYESFWLGERLAYFASIYWWRPNQAHNGYLEVYLNLGLIGLSLVICVLLATYRKARADLLDNFDYGRLRMGWLTAIVMFSWTEAGFRPMGVTIFFIYLIATNYPALQVAESPALVETPSPWRRPLQSAPVPHLASGATLRTSSHRHKLARATDPVVANPREQRIRRSFARQTTGK